MKISVLIPFEEKLNSYYGGAVARWINEVYSKLNDLDIKVYGRICNDKNDYKTINIISRYNFIFEFILNLPYIRRFLAWFYCRIYFSYIKNSKIIEIHNSYKYATILRQFGFKGKIVLHMHNDYLGYLESGELEKLNISIDVLITCSDFLRDRIKNKSNRLYKKSYTVYNGFDEKQFYPKKEDNYNELSIGYVGRIDYNKGLHILLDVYESLLNKIPALKLYVVGSSNFGDSSSDYEDKCKIKIEKLKKEKHAKIEYVGYVHNSNLVDCYNKFTLFCSFSLVNEAFGMTYIEALACKTPVLAHNIGGVKEAVYFQEMLSDSLEVTSLANQAYKILSDKKLNKTLAKKGYKYVYNHYTWVQISENQVKILKNII